MKFNKVLTILFVMIMSSFSYAQDGIVNSVSNRNYMFAESYGNDNYVCSITFKKRFRDTLFSILNTYFEDIKLSSKKTVWKKLRGIDDDNNFYVELKQSSLKIEWKNGKAPHDEIIRKLKEIRVKIENIVR